MNVVYFDVNTCWKQLCPNQQRKESTKHNWQQRYGTYLIKWREMLPDTKPQQWQKQPQPQQPQQQLPAPQRRRQQPSRVGSLSDPTPMQCSGAFGAYV